VTNAVLLVAHGSRREASNDEVRALTDRLAQQAQGRFGTIRCGFLELTEPSIPDGIDALIADGAKRVVVLPYFLSAGRHVAEDIPGILGDCRARHPEVDIVTAPYLGQSEEVVPLLLSLAARQTEQTGSRT